MADSVQQVRETIDEMLTSVRAVKGDSYADLIVFLSTGMHLTKMVAFAVRGAESRMVDALGHQLASTLDLATGMLFEAYNLTKQDENEILKFAEKISDQVDNFIFKGGKK
jgi:hydroxymethylpyrimidine/phosphomethylpyrimidine kinase